MHDVQDEPVFAERAAGLDIAKAEVEATIRVPSDTSSGRRQQETRTFATTRRELESLGHWLRCWGVTKVGMEATGDYWIFSEDSPETRAGAACRLCAAAATAGRRVTAPRSRFCGSAINSPCWPGEHSGHVFCGDFARHAAGAVLGQPWPA